MRRTGMRKRKKISVSNYLHPSKTTTMTQTCKFLILLLWGSFLLTAVCAQEKANLGFEKLNAEGLPESVNFFGTGKYEKTADSISVHSGRYALLLSREDTSTGNYCASALSIDHTYEASSITLKGFIRSEKVNRFTGLWLRLDGDNGPKSAPER